MRNSWISLGIAGCLALAGSAANAQSALVLTCGGGGSAVKPDVRTVQGSGTYSGSYDYGRGNYTGSGSYNGTVYGTRNQGYADQVDLEISGENGRIRLPRITLPVVHGGSVGWFRLKNISVTNRAITANAVVNFMNKPRIYIDRMTGVISINGKNGNYTGRCQAVDASQRRQF